jgi:hypothetical protein
MIYSLCLLLHLLLSSFSVTQKLNWVEESVEDEDES